MKIIGIAGGTGSGKSTLAQALAARLEDALVLPIDWYYRDRSALPLETRAALNFDDPEALDWPLLLEQVLLLQGGAGAVAPVYDFTLHARRGEGRPLAPAQHLIIEGIHAFHEPRLRDCMGLKIFVDCPAEERRRRRIARDVAERGRTVESVCRQLDTQAEPMHRKYVAPLAACADLEINGADLQERIDKQLAGILALLSASAAGLQP